MTKEKLKGLVAERDAIDGQLAELEDLLKSHNVDMESPLVDAEGFPIASLDIVSIRKARHSIICLRNDRKKLTDEIEELMTELHESACSDGGHSQADQSEAPAVHRTSNRPFLKVENVVYGSPAFHAGLKAEDLIVQFGPFHADNFGGLQKLAEMIKEHVGKSVNLTVLRETRVHRLTAEPGEWEGGVGVFGARFNIVHGSPF